MPTTDKLPDSQDITIDEEADITELDKKSDK